MSETGTERWWAHVPEEQHETWLADAEALGMNKSEYIKSMAEAGRKKFEAAARPGDDARELLDQIDELRRERDAAREKVERLRERLRDTERAHVERFIERRPGATYDDVVEHVRENAPERVTRHIDDLRGDGLRIETDEDGRAHYYPLPPEQDQQEDGNGDAPITDPDWSPGSSLPPAEDGDEEVNGDG